MNNPKNELTWNRWGAATGYLAFALGIAAAGFERGAPPANAPVEQSLAYFVKYRTELLAQSLLFVLSAGVLLWFIGSLRSFLSKAEEGTGRLSSVAFGAGILWAGLQLVMQGGQVALAMGANADLPAALAGMMGDLTYALSVIAYVPMGIMLAAMAVVSWRFKAFPAWLAWLSAVAAAANLLMSAGIVAQGGPLVPGGVLTYALYLLQAVWQVATPTVMLARAKA
ncbi:MAG TPA: hypothetical protein VJ345_01900 [Anaerolineales bacterium]|nr:hypothetical protein [Anaerolineales bacterium]